MKEIVKKMIYNMIESTNYFDESVKKITKRHDEIAMSFKKSCY